MAKILISVGRKNKNCQLINMPLAALILVCLSAVIHAVWNLLAHSQQKITGNIFLRCHIFSSFTILLPELVAEWQGDHFSVTVWLTILAAGIFNSIYYFGLTMGYRNGNFTVIYPMSRALPVLFLAGFDIFQGSEPSLQGWLGIILIVIGCAIAPLQSLQKVTFSDYWNLAMIWVLVIALATTGYSAFDKLGVDILPPGNVAELSRFQLLQSVFIAFCLWFMLRFIDHKEGNKATLKNETTLQITDQASSAINPKTLASLLSDWQTPIVVSIFMFGSYLFMLWAYQLSSHVSYLAALRQISIVFGVVVGGFILREPSPGIRIFAAVMIALGAVCITQTS